MIDIGPVCTMIKIMYYSGLHLTQNKYMPILNSSKKNHIYIVPVYPRSQVIGIGPVYAKLNKAQLFRFSLR